MNPVKGIINSLVVDSPWPGNLTYLWGLGLILGLALVIQMITGLYLVMHYIGEMGLSFISVEHVMKDIVNGCVYVYLIGVLIILMVVLIIVLTVEYIIKGLILWSKDIMDKSEREMEKTKRLFEIGYDNGNGGGGGGKWIVYILMLLVFYVLFQKVGGLIIGGVSSLMFITTFASMVRKDSIRIYIENLGIVLIILIIWIIFTNIINMIKIGYLMEFIIITIVALGVIVYKVKKSEGFGTGDVYPIGFEWTDLIRRILREMEIIVTFYIGWFLLELDTEMFNMSKNHSLIGLYTGVSMIGVGYFGVALINNIVKEEKIKREVLMLGLNALLKLILVITLNICGIWGEGIGEIWYLGRLIIFISAILVRGRVMYCAGGAVSNSVLDNLVKIGIIVSGVKAGYDLANDSGLTSYISDGNVPLPDSSLSKGYKNVHDDVIEGSSGSDSTGSSSGKK